MLLMCVAAVVTVTMFSSQLGGVGSRLRTGYSDYRFGRGGGDGGDHPSLAMLEVFQRNSTESTQALGVSMRKLGQAQALVRTLEDRLKVSEGLNAQLEVKASLTALAPKNENGRPILPSPEPLLDDPPEGEVDLAFHIQLHTGTLAMLPRLLRAIWHPRNSYAIHCDQGSLVKPELVDSLIKHVTKNYDNVRSLAGSVVAGAGGREGGVEGCGLGRVWVCDGDGDGL